jgi:hypothetical protein
MAEAEARRGVEMVWGAPRLLVVGDVQGNADALHHLLQLAGLAESGPGGAPTWTGGHAVLLLLGDLVDGGWQPVEVLCTVMALVPQARAAGGRVVVVQGNHEQMLLAALTTPVAEREGPLGRWFSQGGLDTLARLAKARGAEISAEVVAASFVSTLGDLSAVAEDVSRLAAFVEREYAEEIAFLRDATVPAAVVNGCVLGVHAGPDFAARSLSEVGADAAAARALAWDRSWVRQWPEEPDAVSSRLVALKRRLADPSRGVDIRHVVFAHTPLEEFRVPGFKKGTQYRIGRLLACDEAGGVPGLYDVITAPRERPRGGALGGLAFGPEGIVAVYGSVMENDEGRWPQSEAIAEADPAFPG